MQYTQKKFKKEHEITIGVEFTAKNIKLDKNNIRIQIWDTVSKHNIGRSRIIQIYNSFIL